jgi:uncharacterized membrane protein YdbT with pleckstrin-like domain
MLCQSCKTELPADAKFCPKCGKPLTSSAAPPVPTQSPADQLKNAMPAQNDAQQGVEEALWQGGYSGKAMIGSWLAAGLATVLVVVIAILARQAPVAWGGVILILLIWAILAVRLAYRKLGVHYSLTNQRFVHQKGILKRVTDRIEVIDIDDVTYEQSIIQRMVGVGTIKLLSSDRSHPELVLRGVDNVQRIADVIDNARREERRRRGVHIEAI